MNKGNETYEGWGELLRDPVVLATVLIHIAIAFLLLFPVLGASSTALIVEAYALVPITILGIIAPWVGLPPVQDGKERVFWALWSLSLGFHLLVRVIYLLIPGIDSVVTGSFVIDLLYVLFYLPLILSTLLRPDRSRFEVAGRGAWLLEMAGTVVFALGLVAYFMVIPRFFNQQEYETWVPSLLMYWVMDAFLLLSLFHLRETAQTREWRIIYSWLALAPSCWVVTEMMEMTFYLNWEGGEWSTGLSDVLWYVPWVAIILAARMRTGPVPSFFGAGSVDPDQSSLSRSLGRPGWLLVAALVLPLVHIGSNLLGVLDPSTRDLRELVVLLWLVFLLGIAAVHQKILEGKALSLTRRGKDLEERQRQLAAAVDQSPDAVLIADGDGVVSYGNRRFAELEGGLEHLLGASLLSALPPELEGLQGGNLTRVLAESLRNGIPFEGRSVPDPQGEDREELVSVSPVMGKDGRVENWILIRRDVTYLKRLERQVRQAQRMETVGALAGGLSQDFSELLRTIYGHGMFLRRELAPGSASHAEAEALLVATERAADLVNRVLAFSKAGQEEKTAVSVNSVVRETIALLRQSLPGNVRLEAEMSEEGLLEVEGVRPQLKQVVVNLGNNALQAMDPDGGTLWIGVDGVDLDEESAAELELPSGGPHVRLWVRDTGKGMSDSVLERVFDPFFTTRSLEEGTGLGLFLVKETVGAHGGAIRVESAPKWGTQIQVYLPAPDFPPPEKSDSRSPENRLGP